jgi:DNA-binding CsgD family transcriptional regulator
MAKVTVDTIRMMMKKRALGYTQQEIGKVLNVTQATVRYHLGLLRKRANNEGDDVVFTEYFNLVVLSPTEVRFTYGLDTAAHRYTLRSDNTLRSDKGEQQ